MIFYLTEMVIKIANPKAFDQKRLLYKEKPRFRGVNKIVAAVQLEMKLPVLFEPGKLTRGEYRHLTAAVTDVRQHHKVPVERRIVLLGALLRGGEIAFGALKAIGALRHHLFGTAQLAIVGVIIITSHRNQHRFSKIVSQLLLADRNRRLA